jgi:DNA adenine methylase
MVKWVGGKSDDIQFFAEHIPDDYNLYLEPFVGGGAVYFHQMPKKAVIGDVHKELMDFYQCIKDGKGKEYGGELLSN